MYMKKRGGNPNTVLTKPTQAGSETPTPASNNTGKLAEGAQLVESKKSWSMNPLNWFGRGGSRRRKRRKTRKKSRRRP